MITSILLEEVGYYRNKITWKVHEVEDIGIFDNFLDSASQKNL